ncbi:hypothetical protein N0V90_008456 [Kalmusia sp. IMI 367209]|nr:hypothetical protein N0V90_008456 [Kalmusia sp. IMI 367209]
MSSGLVTSRGRRDNAVLLGGDSAHDNAQGIYEGRETLIAIGSQNGKVLVFNVLGLLVHEVVMDSPIIALEWVGNMNAPSVLPNRKRALSTCIEEEGEHPVLDSLLEYYESSCGEAMEEESGTIKKKPRPERSGARSPIRFDGSRDLFSIEPYTSRLTRRRSEAAYGPSPLVKKAEETPRKKSFLRPRIATETFKDPHRGMPVTSPHSNTTATVQQVLERTNSREVYDIFFADALRVSRSPSASSAYSQSSEEEIWTTPPTTQKPIENANTTRPKYADLGSRARSMRSAVQASDLCASLAHNYSRPLPPIVAQEHTPPPSRRDSFADRDSLRIAEQHRSDKRKPTLAERSPIPPPPSQQDRRGFSFEPGLHDQERKWEQKFGETSKKMHEASGKMAGKRRRESVQRYARRSRVPEYELRLEYQRLRQEMALLREEFRALRRELMDSRR